ncbi:uncharacterized protein LOC126388200 [Epinephelus moara]|uniref:uncharacterized protein LOC126388200 n=1 Tax=Epinephelus moara TaxID=300413 RepID=UPI00214F5689|nr:uncharacterized protein LOC126388200 [Epinephelus moara]
MLTHLEKVVHKAKEAHQNWNRWAPPAEQKNFDWRIRALEMHFPELVSQKAALIKAASIKTDTGQEPISVRSLAPVAAIKLKATALPKFAGNQRDYYRWRKEWEALQKQGEPTGSKEVKKFQLLDSLDEKVARDLRLSSYSSSDEIFRVLENRFGNQATIALKIVEELQATPPVRSSHPRRIIELIQTVEKALYDLNELGNADAIKNPLVTKSIEGKLPETLRKDWLTYAADEGNTVNHQNRFDKLITFLKSQESIYEQLDQLRDVIEPAKEKTKFLKYTRTKTTKSSSEMGCIICGDPKHRKKLFFCRRFRTNLKPSEKRDAAQQLGACKRCLEVHNGDYCRNTTYLCGNPECKDQHHYLLCPVARPQSQRTPKSGPGKAEGKRYTEAQEEFLSKLPPELAQQCRHAFCNVTSRAYNSTAAKRGLLEENSLNEYPVILMLLDVTANDGQRIGTLIDLASDTNYITHRAASKLNLKSEDVTLVVYGVGGMKVSVATKRYLLKIRVNTPRGTLKSHQLICYGLDKIAEVHRHVPVAKLQKIFHSPEPHWHAKYPWTEDPVSLPDNKRAVEATFLRTEKQLAKEPDWKTAYASQVHEMVNRKAAVELSKEVLQSWTGPVWYISHLIAPNPHSVSTPVRLVWNNSQKYRGLSLNDILIKGPDVLNPIRAVLLRFRAGVVAALGDIRKMYNSVWLEEREVHLHRFLWHDTEDGEIEEFAITRVNIGDKPAGCIAQVAMRETCLHSATLKKRNVCWRKTHTSMTS